MRDRRRLGRRTRLLRSALAAACSYVRPFSLSRVMILTWASVAVTAWPPCPSGQSMALQPIFLAGISNCHQWVILAVVDHPTPPAQLN